MKESVSNNINYRKIFLFWLPLAGTWLMMSVEGPFLSAVIARMAEPKFNLAAYGVAFSFALIVEAPIIMMMSAATALVENKQTFLKLRNFTYMLNVFLTLLFLLILIPPVFNIIAVDMIQLPAQVAQITHEALFILIPWPAAIGYRRFYQGVMIKYKFTKRVAYGTVIRLIAMSITAFILYSFSNLHGAVVGASALSAGVVSEAVASRFMSMKIIKEINSSAENNYSKRINYKEIIQFYYPLALTSLLSLGVHPIITFFMGQSRMPIESLAVLPVINSLVFIFRSLGLSFHEVAIALMGRQFQSYFKLRNFAIAVGSGSAFLLLLIAFTPLSVVWFSTISGLSGSLTEFARSPLMIMGIMPGLTFLISFQRAILVYSKNTRPLTFATIVEVVSIVAVLIIAIKFFNSVGAVAATSAFITGRLAANWYLVFPYKKAMKIYASSEN
ncbi:MAG: hypothetical protein JW995_06180 [Melioribacteraceae bacterium]|nr:hypothetical protein [Melioribacteraceae bacterium]